MPVPEAKSKGRSVRWSNDWLDRQLIPAVKVLLDTVGVIAGFLVAQQLLGVFHATRMPFIDALTIASLLAAILVVVYRLAGLYELDASVLHLEEMGRVLKYFALAAVLTVFVKLLLAPTGFGGPQPFIALICVGVAIVLVRRFLTRPIGRLRSRFAGKTRVLIYGCGPAGQLLMKKLAQSRHLGRELVGFVDDYARIGNNVACRLEQYRCRAVAIPILGRGPDLPRLIDECGIDELFVTTSVGDLEHVRQITERHRHVRAAFLPELGHVRADQLQVQEVGALPLLRPIETPKALFYCAAKRMLDSTLAALALVLLSPLWLLIAAAIKLDSPGPVIFRQLRIGEGGKPFTLYKFRTLHTSSDPYSKSHSVLDPRATRVGSFLRLTGLDEIAQLLNVLKGDMSLVGPRPEMPFIVDGRQRPRAYPLERQAGHHRRVAAQPRIERARQFTTTSSTTSTTSRIADSFSICRFCSKRCSSPSSFSLPQSGESLVRATALSSRIRHRP